MSYDCRARSIRVEPIAGASPFDHPATYCNPPLPHSTVQFRALFERQKRPADALLASLAAKRGEGRISFELQPMMWRAPDSWHFHDLRCPSD